MLGTFCYMANYLIVTVVIIIISGDIDELQEQGKSTAASAAGVVEL